MKNKTHKILIIVLFFLLIVTNIFWIYTFLDQISSNKYSDILQYQKTETVNQLLALSPHISIGDSKPKVINIIKRLTPEEEAFEKDGSLYSGFLEFIFDSNDRLKRIEELIKSELEEYSKSGCIPDSVFRISNISYKSTKSDILKLKGQPDSIIVDKFLNLETLFYPQMCVELTNNHVFNFSTEVKNDSTPCGIRPGLAKSDVYKKLEKYDIYLDDKNDLLEYQYMNCEEEYYLILIFDTLDYLQKLEFGIDLP